MKRIIALLLCLLLAALSFVSLAESDLPFPFDLPEPTPAPSAVDGESILLELNGEMVELKFDDSPEYSSAEAGLIQASFFAYAADGVTLYELFLIFPETVQPGMIITPEYSALVNVESSVVLIQSDDVDEIYYFASIMDGSTYPSGSDFSISIEDVVDSDGSVTYSGTLTAHLVALDMATGDARASLDIDGAAFKFSLGSASQEPRHSNPMPSATPEDMRRT
ncbi:MAG: hypothetical protein Q4C10_00905 [Clostridia bacterium]|nr:hypothetical protein [Clostridia bacterium]